MLASLCLLSGGARAQVVMEFDGKAGGGLGISHNALPRGITAGPDDNLWFTENGIDRIGRIIALSANGTIGHVDEFDGKAGGGPGITAGAFPTGITAGPCYKNGPDCLWFTEFGVDRIGRIIALPTNGTVGHVDEFDGTAGGGPGITAGASPFDIAAGPCYKNGPVCLWFTEINGDRIGRLTPPTDSSHLDAVVDEFSAGITPNLPVGITAGPCVSGGPNDCLWFAEGNRIVRLTPPTDSSSLVAAVDEFSTGITAGAGVAFITAGPCFTGGPDCLWFTEQGGNRIGRIDPTTHVIDEFSAGITAGGVNLYGITAGPCLNGGLNVCLWFTEADLHNGNRIGRLIPPTCAPPCTDAVIKEFSLSAGALPLGITAGPDGNLWFAEGADRIGQITTGAVSALPPTIVKSFGKQKILLGRKTSLSFTITNPNVGSDLNGVGFTDNLPAGLVVSTPSELKGKKCDGGTITAVAGTGTVSWTGATLAASASCIISVKVTGTMRGKQTNTTGAVTSIEGGKGGTASAIVTVK